MEYIIAHPIVWAAAFLCFSFLAIITQLMNMRNMTKNFSMPFAGFAFTFIFSLLAMGNAVAFVIAVIGFFLKK